MVSDSRRTGSASRQSFGRSRRLGSWTVGSDGMEREATARHLASPGRWLACAPVLAPRRSVAMLAAATTLAFPAVAVAQSAGDDQYNDPFGGKSGSSGSKGSASSGSSSSGSSSSGSSGSSGSTSQPQ